MVRKKNSLPKEKYDVISLFNLSKLSVDDDDEYFFKNLFERKFVNQNRRRARFYVQQYVRYIFKW